MDFSEGKTVVEMIREKYNQIFMAERKVADFVLENPERAVNANVSELANLSGVSDATVIRFCKRIGFQGHYQFRITLSRDLGRIMGGYSRKENEIKPPRGCFRATPEKFPQLESTSPMKP